MYETTPKDSIAPLAGGIAVLPETGANTLLTIVAITAIAVGIAIIVSTLVRAAAAKAYKS